MPGVWLSPTRVRGLKVFLSSANPEPKPWAPACHLLQETALDCRSQGACAPARQTHAHAHPPHVQVECTSPWEPLPTLTGYLDPRPQSWFHGQEGQRLG